MVNVALHIFDHFHLLTPLLESVVKVPSLDKDVKIGIILSFILSIRIFIFWTIYLPVSGRRHSDNLQSEKRVNVILQAQLCSGIFKIRCKSIITGEVWKDC